MNNTRDIRLMVFSAPNNNKNAVRWAAAMWHNKTGGVVNISETATGAGGTIIVGAVDASRWSLTPCGRNASGCVSHLPAGHADSVVYLRSKFNGGVIECDWNNQTLNAVVVHEFGHALGLHHPTPANGVHIPGTAQCKPGSNNLCDPNDPGYDTVMKRGLNIVADCTLKNQADGAPYPDDVKSVKAINNQ